MDQPGVDSEWRTRYNHVLDRINYYSVAKREFGRNPEGRRGMNGPGLRGKYSVTKNYQKTWGMSSMKDSSFSPIRLEMTNSKG